LLTEDVEVGKIYEGRVVSVKDFGAFIEVLPGKDGLCHISELSDGYVNQVSDICQVGDLVKVKVILIDDQNRLKLSRRAVLMEEGGGDSGQADPRPPRGRDPRS
jgi:polyribonucleotide nucleotidyltransferase